jgi:aerobic C4-dicarboxylate transport protein
VATWTNQLDREQLSAALSGESPFDEARMIDDHADVREPDPAKEAARTAH